MSNNHIFKSTVQILKLLNKDTPSPKKSTTIARNIRMQKPNLLLPTSLPSSWVASQLPPRPGQPTRKRLPCLYTPQHMIELRTSFFAWGQLPPNGITSQDRSLVSYTVLLTLPCSMFQYVFLQSLLKQDFHPHGIWSECQNVKESSLLRMLYIFTCSGHRRGTCNSISRRQRDSVNGALLAWKTRFVVLVWIFPFLWDMKVPSVSYASARSQYIINWAATQCGILMSVDSDEPVQPPYKLTNSKWCSVNDVA